MSLECHLFQKYVQELVFNICDIYILKVEKDDLIELKTKTLILATLCNNEIKAFLKEHITVGF